MRLKLPDVSVEKFQSHPALLRPFGCASDGDGSPASAQAKRRAPGGARVRRRSLLLSLLRRLQSFSDWLDESWLGALLGTLIIFSWLVAVPVLLPLIFEVMAK